ncbi:hypothetical protein [Actinomadura sp. B10D3]|uniref:hypothetical protein n=1 Tax=Actinomadura sp. B10D3 TaxID=3153557 RepID=UPI00325EAB8D
MSKDFATLLAQVIPVIMLALILELGNMVSRPLKEGEELKNEIDETSRELERNIASAERLVAEAESHGDSINAYTVQRRIQDMRDMLERSRSQRDRLNGARKKNSLIVLFLISFYGATLVILGACETLSLYAADGAKLPVWAGDIAVTFVTLAMFAVITYPILGWIITNSILLDEFNIPKKSAVARVLLAVGPVLLIAIMAALVGYL